MSQTKTSKQSRGVKSTVAREDPRKGTRVVGADTTGDKKYQTVLAAHEVDGAVIREVLDVVFYYSPKRLRYGVTAHDSDGGPLLGNGWPGSFESELGGQASYSPTR